ncbi:MAG: hypothetical protein J6R85_01025 [Lentisphaeria bacterium]|nr:hypothetical protein [Lentisphaeria bacterium]
MSTSTVTAAALTALFHNIPYRVCAGAKELNPLTAPPVIAGNAQVRHFLACKANGQTEDAAWITGETLRITIRTGHLLAAAELLTLLESGKIGPDSPPEELVFSPWDPAITVPKIIISAARMQPEWKFLPGQNGAPDSCELTWICRKSASGTPLIRWEV